MIPSLSQLQDANPHFFSDDWGEFGKFSNHSIEEEHGRHVLKLQTLNGTCPVYAVDPDDLSLSFLRHGWAPCLLS